MRNLGAIIIDTATTREFRSRVVFYYPITRFCENISGCRLTTNSILQGVVWVISNQEQALSVLGVPRCEVIEGVAPRVAVGEFVDAVVDGFTGWGVELTIAILHVAHNAVI